MEIRVSSRQSTTWVTNPISGHSWPEYGPITGYEVRGPLGLWSTHKSETAANKEAEELREYYQKYPINH